MACVTGYIIVLKHLTIYLMLSFFLTAVQAVVSCLFYFPPLLFPGTNLSVAFDMVPIFAVLYLGAVVTLGAYGLYNYAIKLVPASRVDCEASALPYGQ